MILNDMSLLLGCIPAEGVHPSHAVDCATESGRSNPSRVVVSVEGWQNACLGRQLCEVAGCGRSCTIVIVTVIAIRSRCDCTT